MKFLEMDIENFGPYYSRTVIELEGQKDGVTIFWGNNGRGKTTLLNAFRYALYGEIKKRNNKEVNYFEMINKIGSQEGKNYFTITLKIEDAGDVFELTRKYSLRDKTAGYSENKDDYEMLTFLKKNNVLLSRPDTEKYIAALLPKDISRFFLFDGELLQEYESLLEDGNESGDKIKTSIEKILGLPYLVNSLSDCKQYHNVIESQRRKSIQEDDKTKKVAASYNSLCEEIDSHNNAIIESKGQLEELKSEKLALEQSMSETKTARDLLTEINKLEQSQGEKRRLIEVLRNNLKSSTKEAWKYHLKDKTQSLIKQIKDEIDFLKSKETKQQIDNNIIKMLEKTRDTCECSLCRQKVDSEIIKYLNNQIDELTNVTEDRVLTNEEKSRIVKLQNILDALMKQPLTNFDDDIKKTEAEIEQYKVEINDADVSINNLKNKLSGLENYKEEDTSILTLPKQYADCEAKIANLKHAIEEEEKTVQELILNRNDLEKKMAKFGNKDLEALTSKANLVEAVCNIFNEAIDLFRNKLKNNVEKDATELFKKLSAEKDYVRLSINDNYGLAIINSNGMEAPNRSAGYEHIVALSLIGALHKNAPLKGPIIMDSPFGRLDPENKKNVCKVLPDLANQVVLLMYEDEINADLIRDILQEKLINEHKLLRIESMNTEIE